MEAFGRYDLSPSRKNGSGNDQPEYQWEFFQNGSQSFAKRGSTAFGVTLNSPHVRCYKPITAEAYSFEDVVVPWSGRRKKDLHLD